MRADNPCLYEPVAVISSLPDSAGSQVRNAMKYIENDSNPVPHALLDMLRTRSDMVV